MRAIAARRVLPGARVAEAEALWLDLRRWPGFVDGFASVGRLEGDWPQPGTRLVWDSRPGGRGRVAERVVAYEPGSRLATSVEDGTLLGTQSVAFAELGSGCEMTLELAYELKRPGFGGALTDLFFVRHALRESLRRTLERFAIELQADRELI
ncbi:MAG TPA: SRPBCC family protein [Solirubrobacteraceae bacterium]|nr:SRPBCC family protein [Solirubrobacteraceae bacterium]